MYFVTQFAIIENGTFPRYESDIRVKAKMQCLKFNQFCTRFYVSIHGKYRADAIGYEVIIDKLVLYKPVGSPRLFVLCVKISVS